MSASGEVPDDLGNFDWDAFAEMCAAPPDASNTMLSAVARHNEQAIDSGQTTRVINWNLDKHDLPELVTPNFGNDLAVEVPDGFAKRRLIIGYFSPAEGAFTVFPDLVKDEEVESLQAAANAQRQADIEAFSRSTNPAATRTDYAHPDVRALHEDQVAYLDSGAVNIMDIIERYNNSLGETAKESGFLDVDAYTQAFLTLRKEGRKANYYITVAVKGAFKRMGELKQRELNRHINLARRDDTSDGPLDFIPFSKMLKSYGVEELADRAAEIFVAQGKAELDGHKLDLQELGYLVHPTGTSD